MPTRAKQLISYDQLGRIVEGSASEIYAFCPKTFKFLLVNRGARENLGYSSQELSELTPWDLKPMFAEAKFRSIVEPLLNGSIPELTFETVHRRKNGSDYDVSVHLQLLATEENEVFFAAIRDVTDENRLDAELELKTVQLQEALTAKEVLLHEVNHRVKNSLQVVMSLLRLQSRQANDSSLKVALSEAEGRIAVVAAIHQKLYSTSQHSFVNFSEFLDSLSAQVIGHMSVMNGIKVEKELEQGLVLGIEIAVPLALITAEILTNSAKYAFPEGASGTIRLRLHCDDEKVTLKIEDNGVGLPAAFDSVETQGLGTRIIKALSKQIRATLNVDTGPDGTAFQLEFPHCN